MANYQFTVTHKIMATPQRVYDVWLSPDDPRGPWVGDGQRALDARVGGRYNWFDHNFSDLGGGGGAWDHWGEFTRLEPGKLIEYTWTSEWTDYYETKILVEFAVDSDDPRFCAITLTQSNLPDNWHGHEHSKAWMRILGEMSARFWGNAERVSRV
ncbi:hypothetical protein GCM10027445_16160 [Amycolatopsis endophytica]|uniref:Uncharacterized protein YndB with AHSA1/START domain n=1 Tax=Amycolatopsis endophytica TaxID=860233 RepID=A0A853B593_9PSEU|nr:SRPBCC domain-containing protein [Amycolatopsis endophytica]NYI90170.1 uncharacterized protein YndB with AHSA1/START domain [Amycolatopsis endophytica]